MDSWKNFKRSGNFRRKVSRKLRAIKNCRNEPLASRDTNQHPEDTAAAAFFNISPSVNEVINEVMDVELEEIRVNWENEFDQPSEPSQMEKLITLKNDVIQWALKYRSSHESVRAICKVINKCFGKVLPEDARTLLKTPKKVELMELGNGHYWHNGVQNCLTMVFKNHTAPSTISLNINMDGLPIYNSSKKEFWPILGSIHEIPNLKPMVFGIFCGLGKPSTLQQYLGPFTTEMEKLMAEGYKMASGQTIPVSIRAIICDSPARAFIKGIN